MATLTLGIAQTQPRLTSRWIIGKGVDLSLVIGSSVAGYLYLLLSLVFQVPISYLWWFWSVGFDGTHIFGTASRTYFDSRERRENGRMLYGSLAFFFLLGPAMVLAGLKGYLALLVGVWAYYHVLQQHHGFVMLYKVKNGDLAERDNRLDRWFLAVMMIAPPFHRFFIHSPRELGLPAGAALSQRAPAVEWAMWTVVAAAGFLFLARQWERLRNREALNLPKLLLLAGVIPLHWLTFSYMSWQAAVPTVTIVHNLQYHALIWFHNRNRYGAGEGIAAGRIPRAVASSLAAYAVIALVFSILYRVPGFQLGRVSDLAFGFFCGFGLTHYYLDSRIWRVRRDPGLRRTLRLA